MINQNLTQHSPTVRKNQWKQYSLVLAWAGLALGLLDLFNHFFTIFNQTRQANWETNMQWHLALALVLASGGLFYLHRNWLIIVRLGAMLILLLAFLYLAEFFWQTDWHLFPVTLAESAQEFAQQEIPHWVLLLNGLNLILLALILLSFSLGWTLPGQLMAAFLFLLAYASLIGNLYNIDGLYPLKNFSGITSHTALTLALISLGLLFYCPSKGWMKIVYSPYLGGMLARYSFSYFLLVSPIFMGFYLYTLSEWNLTPGLGILSLFILTCLITLPITYYYLHRLNALDARLRKAHQELQITNTDLSGRNQELSEALADVKIGNRELAVMTKEALLGSQALEAKNKELSRLNQSLDYIVHMASHDLKTPIYNLELLLQELRPSLEPHMQAHEEKLVIMVANSIASLKSTIEGLTQIIKSQQLIIGKQVAFSLTKLIQEIKKELAREIEQSDAQINKYLEVDTIVFSQIHLRSVLFNLFSNALKYRVPDRSLVVDIRSQAVPNGLELIIQDNGLGMSEYQVAHLFTIYKRFHKHVEGSGIGLFLVKQTIENNGGTIQVESTESVGTRFTIFLPQQKK
ncbi:sensor histidine kinase [Adhaeribacter rhizoryzae]|uniref:histidine kinase n=1 Tax=Adhaeribacter rhizoryzae TaxID=2607907 RepID=A0A5M6D5R8_9BACT|nr:HAMP domain-containing sensor histidine kinase [Adhaeribacter rhizoryzae]KAA5542857.1 HAMP domain-containing histidine kinase [Adhaeribacter rhizoryzae]